MKRILFLLGISTAVFGFSIQGFAGWTNNLTGPAQYGGTGLPYHMYVPDSQPTVGNGRALMLSLHGCTMSHDIMRDRANWEPIAEEKGVIVIAIDENAEDTMSCFNWEQKLPSEREGSSQASRIIQIAQSIIADSQYNIDPNQVYISGVSAGANEAWIVACLAPDIFAGAGIVASPMIHVPAAGGLKPGYEPRDPQYVISTCEGFAGSYVSDIDTQVFSFLQGSSDTVVDYRYLENNTTGMVEGLLSVHGIPGKTYSNPDSNTGALQYDYANSTLKVWKEGEAVRLSYISIWKPRCGLC